MSRRGNALRNAEASFLVQQYISEAAGQDLRCLVLDGKVIAAMVRRANGDDFRANLHKGGIAFAEADSKQREDNP